MTDAYREWCDAVVELPYGTILILYLGDEIKKREFYAGI